MVSNFWRWLKLFSYCMKGHCLTNETRWPQNTGQRWRVLKNGKWEDAPKPPLIYDATLGNFRVVP